MATGTLAILWTAKSSNEKTGPMPVSTTSKNTCPIGCPFMGNGCYAESGPLAFLWTNLSNVQAAGDTFKNGKATMHSLPWHGFTAKVAALPEGTVWRHNQAGDLPNTFGMISDTLMTELVAANRGKRGFTYTHHNVLQNEHNRNVVAFANREGFTINLSGNNLAHADALANLAIAPVVTVLPYSFQRTFDKSGWTEELDAYRARTKDLATPKGRKVAPCPATYLDDVSCATCKLCAVRDRKVIVGFPAHGSGKAKASHVAS
jgi:hypothetical protein